MKGIKKALGGVLLATGLASLAMTLPQQAFALGWGAKDMISNTTKTTELDAKPITQKEVADWVTSVTTWVLAIAIVLFVLKVVLTAIDRLLFQQNVATGGQGTRAAGRGSATGDEQTLLQRIPFLGAYPQTEGWKEIWIHFGKNVAIVAGAWVLVNLVVNVVLWLFDAVTTGKG